MLTLTGIVVGVTGAVGSSRYLEGLLFGMTPLDVSTFAAVAVTFWPGLPRWRRMSRRAAPLASIRMVALRSRVGPAHVASGSQPDRDTTTMKRFFRRTLSLFTRNRAEDDLAREMTAHLALLESEHQPPRPLTRRGATGRAPRNGQRPRSQKDLHRDAGSFRWLDDLRQDATHTVRGLRFAPGFGLSRFSPSAWRWRRTSRFRVRRTRRC